MYSDPSKSVPVVDVEDIPSSRRIPYLPAERYYGRKTTLFIHSTDGVHCQVSYQHRYRHQRHRASRSSLHLSSLSYKTHESLASRCLAGLGSTPELPQFPGFQPQAESDPAGQRGCTSQASIRCNPFPPW